jgi:predicted Zn-dependent protease
MLTREQANKLAEKILSYSKLPECSVAIEESESAHIRFANNGVSTSGLAIKRDILISSTRERRTGTTRISDIDEAALKAAVALTEELAAVSPVNEEDVAPLGPQKYPRVPAWDESTAAARGPVLVAQVKPAIERAAKDKLVAAGLIERTALTSVIANKAGNFGYARAADVRLSTTIRRPDGSSSGWAGQPAARIAEISGAEIADRAARKCVAWSKPVRLEPGQYDVVLEPTAVSDLLRAFGFMALSARLADEGRSVFSKTGGGTLLGEETFPEIITLRSDPFDKRFAALPWSQDGVPNRPISWIEKGVVKNLSYDRYWAQRSKHEVTPSAEYLILDGTGTPADELIRATERGLLVTRFWYIRMLNPRTLQFTGLTRDGLFLIENGKVTQPVMNFRFNESPFRLLQNARQLGQTVRCRGGEGGGMVAPSMRAGDFTFSSISDAV